MTRLRRNNNGSTIVLVLVVLAVVGILAAVALWISLANFNMKVTDQKITDNFYSAEEVLDDIRAGLQTDVSDALETSYSKSLSEFSSFSDTSSRNANFANYYVNALRSKLAYTDPSTGTDDTKCDLAKLRSYVASEKTTNGTLVLTAQTGGSDYAMMSATTAGVTIKNLHVEYTDSKGYLSIIETDIVLQIPEMNLMTSDSVPNVFSYSIIGNEGVAIGTTSSPASGCTIEGNVYAGSEKAAGNAQGTMTDKEYNKSLVLASNSSVNFSGSEYVIADGDAYINGNGGNDTDFTTQALSQFWARNIYVDHANAALYGTTYASDDMTLSGSSQSVTFSADPTSGPYGSYYGYGTSTTDSSQSSAIILNGKNSTLDLRGISEMVVAGYAYIGTSALNNATDTSLTNSDVMTGESIAVKGDQIAYLVPTECIGTLANGTQSQFNENPMSYATYKKIVDSKTDGSATYQLVNPNTIINRTGKSLASYIGASNLATNGIDHYIQTIFVPSKTGSGDSDGQVYIYLKLDADAANSYFMDYYNNDSGKLDKYVNFYSNGIQALGDTAQIFTAGAYVEYDETAKDAKYTVRGTDTVNGGVANYPNTYTALTKRLVDDYTKITSTHLSNTLFNNLIQTNEKTSGAQDGFKQFVAVLPNKEFSGSVAGAGGGTLYFVMKDGDYTFDDSDSTHQYILIVDGDVTVKSNFTGTIIATGEVTVEKTNITMKTMSTENVKKLLAMECSNGTTKLSAYEFFLDGSMYISRGYGSTNTSVVLDTNPNQIVLSDLIIYQNWKKK